MAEWLLETLDRTHERGEFSCGKAPLDDFLHARATQYQRRRLGTTFVAIRPDDKRVLGYYTLASGAIPFTHLPPKAARKLPKHPVPAILLARLAVDTSAQGQGVGRTLLIDALRRSLELSARLGVHAIEVEAIDVGAKAFYENFGFVPLLDSALHLYLPMTTIEEAYGRS